MPFLDLNLSICNGKVSTKIFDIRGDFDFDIINFPFLDGDVPRRISYGVHISQLVRFARASSNVSDFICRNKALTAKLLTQDYRYHFERRFQSFIAETVGWWENLILAWQNFCNKEYRNQNFMVTVYRIRKIVGESNFAEQFRNLLTVIKEQGKTHILCGRLHA